MKVSFMMSHKDDIKVKYRFYMIELFAKNWKEMFTSPLLIVQKLIIHLYFFKGFSKPSLPACMSPLGLQSGQIPDAAMVASSSSCSPNSARLYSHPRSGRKGAWCAGANNVYQWFQVDFGKYVKIQKVATQGSQDTSAWVKSYRLAYSPDGVFFEEYKMKDGQRVIVHGFIVKCYLNWVRVFHG